MFGGFGIFHAGLMIALISDGSLYFKADDQTRPLFEDAGMGRFSYFKKEKECFLSYFLAPESFFEDQDDALVWVTLAYDAALRAAKKKSPKKKS
jgi:DNA transformation protein